jgi:uncharacterized protein
MTRQTLLNEGLLSAAADGNLADVRRYLDNGAKPDARTEWGAPAIVLAAEGGHTNVVQELIGRGANVDARRPGAESALMTATVHGHFAIVQQLLAAGADTSQANHWGKTALHLAAVYGHADIARQLLVAGADTYVQDEDSHTPKDIAQGELLALICEAEDERFQNDLKGYNRGLDRAVNVKAPMRIRKRGGPRPR